MRLAISVLLAAALVGCRSTSEPSGPPDASGSIVARDVQTATNHGATIHVKERTDEECGVVYSLGSRIPIVRRLPDGSVRFASLDDLTVGTLVNVWSTGILLQSCPAQGVATAVEILDAGSVPHLDQARWSSTPPVAP